MNMHELLGQRRKSQLRNMTDYQLRELGNSYRTMDGLTPDEALPTHGLTARDRRNEIEFILGVESADPEIHWNED